MQKGIIRLGFLLSLATLTAFPITAAANGGGECVLSITKNVSAATATVGEVLTYTIDVENTGTDMCTGGGVKIEDDVDINLTFLSETHSPNFSAGYGCSSGDPCGPVL
ncbi:MAG: hypothetical protein AAB601_00395, partial [Patescibacteria group bacterium]